MSLEYTQLFYKDSKMINEDQFFDFFHEHWDNYSKMSEYMQDFIQEQNAEFASLQQMVDTLSQNVNPQDHTLVNQLRATIEKKDVQIRELKKDLLKCQDNLDEETHQIDKK